MFSTIRKYIPNVHVEGYQFIIIGVFCTLIFSLLSSALAFFGALSTLYVVYFFRDPKRMVIQGDNYIISPADGIISDISEVDPPQELEMKATKMRRVSIFLSVFNVHVNRIPCSGKVDIVHYRPGKFINASLDKSSEDNERQCIKLISSYNNQEIGLAQIAGLIARRIVCDLEANQEVKSGDRFGIIRFGSRVDVYLPLDMNIRVSIGQTMIGGETIIADMLRNDENAQFETI